MLSEVINVSMLLGLCLPFWTSRINPPLCFLHDDGRRIYVLILYIHSERTTSHQLQRSSLLLWWILFRPGFTVVLAELLVLLNFMFIFYSLLYLYFITCKVLILIFIYLIIWIFT